MSGITKTKRSLRIVYGYKKETVRIYTTNCPNHLFMYPFLNSLVNEDLFSNPQIPVTSPYLSRGTDLYTPS